MATRYRDLVGPTMVDTTSMETGNSEAAAELANAFKSFEGIGIDALGKMRSAQGQQEGAEDAAAVTAYDTELKALNGKSIQMYGQKITPDEERRRQELVKQGRPNFEFRAGLRAQTAYGAAYNNAAMRSYAIKAEADAEDNAARLEVEAQNDPEKFATLFGAFRDESIKQAPKEARGTLSTIYAQRMGAGVTRLTRGREIAQNNLARADTLEGVERTIDKIANLYGGDDLSSGLGMVAQGNIDIHARPVVQNKDGSVSTVRSISIGTNRGEVLIPTVSEDGRIMTNEEAINTFRKTGKHLGVFDSPAAATSYARRLHDQQNNEYVHAAEAEAQLKLMIDGAVNDGTISMTEGQALHKSAGRQILMQTVSARFRGVLDSPTQSPVDFIEKLRAENKNSDALSPKEEDDLVDSLVAELSQHNQLMNTGLAESNATLKARYEQGNRDATAELFSGTLTVSTLRTMVQQQKLDPDTARSLMNELQSGGNKIVDDQKELFHFRTDLINISDDDIKSNTKLSYDTRADLLLKKRELEQTWKGTQAAHEAKERIERSLGILPGTDPKTLNDAQRAQLDQAMTTWYNEVDKLPAGERQAAVITTAEDVVTRFIRKEKASTAQEARTSKQRFIDAQLAKYGPPEKYDEQARKKYQESLQRFDATILQNESEAARK